MAVTTRPLAAPLETIGRKVRVIVNPVSGRGRHLRHLERMRRMLAAVDFEAEILVTERRGDAERYAAESAPETALLLCVGGDGTLNEIANGNLDHKIPIALVPAGTGNILRKEFRLPRRIRQACRLALEGQVVWLDAMKVGDRVSLMVTGAGFDSRIAHDFGMTRSGTMRMSQYVWPIFREILHHHHQPIDVYADGDLLCKEAAHVIVCNTRSYGGPFEVGSRASATDGRMDVVVFPRASRTALVRYVWGALRHQLDRHADVIYRQVRRLDLEGPADLPYQVDGDTAGFLPISIQVLPRAIPIIVA